MEADIRRQVDAICKVIGIIRQTQIFRESVISLPQSDDQSLACPSYKIVPVEIRLPGIDLVYVKAGQGKQPCSEFNKIHRYYISIMQQI